MSKSATMHEWERRMNKRLLVMATAAALAAPAAGADVQIQRGMDDAGLLPLFGYGGRPGKGKGRRPYHRSKRFVAQDKREARRARNRRN